MRPSRLALAAVVCLAACRRNPSPIPDAGLASCIPPGATIVGGVDLQVLRASPLYSNLPLAARNALEPLRDASYAIVASDGVRFVVAAKGRLAGATMLAPGLALSGSPDFVAAASAQHRAGKPGAPQLLARAPAAPFWIVADGSANLAVSGNARNLNRLLHSTEYTTIAATFAARPAIQATGVCRSEDEARHLEETVRALVSLGERQLRQPIQLRRDGATLTVGLELEPEEILRLF